LIRSWRGAHVRVYDSDSDQGRRFRAQCAENLGVSVTVVRSATDVLMAEPDVLVLATTAGTPWIDGFSARPPGLVLHVSLRDLAPGVIARCRNVVDDVAHVCRERTSVHLAAERLGHRRFIDATIGEMLRGTKTLTAGEPPVVVSPFGLGILDVAVGTLVYRRARTLGIGTVVAAA
jgi:ornithine cyclodeaminase